MRTENFQMYKLDLEKAKEPEIKFPTFVGILSAALSQHDLSGFEIAPLEFHHLP